MAARIVVLGCNLDGKARCVEIDSPDAGALIAEGRCRVSLTKYAGPLHDATVLEFDLVYLAHLGYSDETAKKYLQREVCEEAWRRLVGMPLTGRKAEFEVDVPVPLGVGA